MRALLLFLSIGVAFAQEPPPTRYLAFQLFTSGVESAELRLSFPPPPADLRKTVAGLRDRIAPAASPTRKLAFIVGPLSFDQTDDQVRALIASAFDIARETGVAVGFHIDDSMFWSHLKQLNTPDNLEWLDWARTPNTGRRLDWSVTPKKIAPQLCINSAAVTEAVRSRATLIGVEIARGLGRFTAAQRSALFLGIIAGWETQIGHDFETGKYPGYCALTNSGYSAAKPPPDTVAALAKIIREFAALWAQSLIESGVPAGKVYSHIALTPGTPPATAFCDSCVPGLSTYPEPGHLDQWRAELAKHSNPAWASPEGTSVDPASGRDTGMESYLASLFNHGAVFVNIFGWGVGDDANPFRKVAEADTSLAVYRKFLNGEKLNEAPEFPPSDLPAKIHQIQAALPAWIQAHGASRVQPLMTNLDAALKARRFDEAQQIAGQILTLLSQ
jgi:hypothetical protein